MVATPMTRKEKILINMIVLCTCRRIVICKRFRRPVQFVPFLKTNDNNWTNATINKNEQKI